MAISSLPLNSIGSSGAFVASAGTLLEAVAVPGGAYGSSTAESTQFFGGTDNFGASGTINSVTVRITARLATAGSRDLTAGIRPPGTSLLSYNDVMTPVTSTSWTTYDFVWTVDPNTGVPFTTSSVDDITRVYVRCAATTGSTDCQIDLVEVVVDYGAAANSPPTADAGADQTTSSYQTVTLTGAGTDTDGTIASGVWTQTGGTAVTLAGSGLTRTFTSAASVNGETLTFSLVVTDNEGATSLSDAMTVTVLPHIEWLKTADEIVPIHRSA